MVFLVLSRQWADLAISDPKRPLFDAGGGENRRLRIYRFRFFLFACCMALMMLSLAYEISNSFRTA
jgi:hypothetical protein